MCLHSVTPSTGGLTSHGTADELKAWREAMPEGAFLRSQRRINIELVKARALRVRGTSSLAFTDYDLKVLSLGDGDARSTVGPTPANYKLADFCWDKCGGWLDKVGKTVEKRAPRVAGGTFKPLILSTGGLRHEPQHGGRMEGVERSYVRRGVSPVIKENKHRIG